MNKKYIIIVTITTLLVGGGFFAIVNLANNGNNAGKDTVEATPTPAKKTKEVDKSVEADLIINPARTKVTIKLTGLGGRYEGVAYELRYTSDAGEKGAVGGLRTPIPLEDGADEFKRDVELGTCSTGGNCRYDTGVKNISLTMKLYTLDGEIEVLQKTFEEL